MRLIALAPVLFVAACGGSGSRVVDPHSSSVSGHELAAQREDRESVDHAAQYDPSKTTYNQHCPGSAASKYEESPCWSEYANSTDSHLAESNEHAKLAQEHRAASKSLQDAEAAACAGVSEADRNTSPFHHRDDIAKVIFTGATGSETSVTIVFKAVPGLIAASLQKIVDCHLARNAALGHMVPEMAYCPLVPNGAKATVGTVDGALSVTVSDDDAAARTEVIARAKKLSP